MKKRDDNQSDPLGLVLLGQTIEVAPVDSPEIHRIKAAFDAVMSRYTALQDRYRLLKAANRQLAEEVAWLRDQCDDFALDIDESPSNAAAESALPEAEH
jgi:hypothetical protein